MAGQLVLCCAVLCCAVLWIFKARTAELLQLHTELRRALFGRSTVMNRSILPPASPLDLLKFLQMWDYEGGLSDPVGEPSLGAQALMDSRHPRCTGL